MILQILFLFSILSALTKYPLIADREFALQKRRGRKMALFRLPNGETDCAKRPRKSAFLSSFHPPYAHIHTRFITRESEEEREGE